MTVKLQFDRQKYLDILSTQGLSAALTALHRDQERFEFETFEGSAGYQPEAFVDLQEIHQFSRELWNIDLERRDQAAKNPTNS